MTSHIEQQASNVQGHPKLPDQILGGMSDLAVPNDGPDVIHDPGCLYAGWPTMPCTCKEGDAVGDHDPLCLCAKDDYRCGDCYDDCVCGCVDIRRVRPLITAEALDAALEAVARQCGHTKSMSSDYLCDHDRALAAIDALRGES